MKILKISTDNFLSTCIEFSIFALHLGYSIKTGEQKNSLLISKNNNEILLCDDSSEKDGLLFLPKIKNVLSNHRYIIVSGDINLPSFSSTSPIITYGYKQKNTVTLSSNTSKIIPALQREILNYDGKIISPREYTLDVLRSSHHLLGFCACAIVLDMI